MQLWGQSEGKMGKQESIPVFGGEGEKIMITHLIINHSFLRLITQLLVTSQATQKFLKL